MRAILIKESNGGKDEIIQIVFCNAVGFACHECKRLVQGE
jgi:hypothetical protein